MCQCQWEIERAIYSMEANMMLISVFSTFYLPFLLGLGKGKKF